MQEIQLLMLILSEMKYTREQAEGFKEEFLDWFGRTSSLLNNGFKDFLDHKFPTETELTRTIKKAEKIADKLEKLLSSQRS